MNDTQPQSPIFRSTVRRLFHSVRDTALDHEDAPEGLDAYDWRALPWREEDADGVIVPVDPNAPNIGFAIGFESIEVPKKVVRINPWLRGVVRAPMPDGSVDLPWWIGYVAHFNIAVVVCGP